MKYRKVKKLNKWFADNGFKGITCYRNNDFEAQVLENKIGIADHIAWDKTMEYSFISLVQKIGLWEDTYLGTLVFLHELGHLQTWEEFSRFDELLYIAMDKIIMWVLGASRNKLYGAVNYFYQRVPQEKRATQWAIDFVNENSQAVEELEKILYE